MSDNSSVTTPWVFLQFFLQQSLVKISLRGILFGVSVQILPFAVLNGLSRKDCFVHLMSFLNPTEKENKQFKMVICLHFLEEFANFFKKSLLVKQNLLATYS